MGKQTRKQEDELELKLIRNLTGSKGYTVISSNTNDRYFQFTIRRNRK